MARHGLLRAMAILTLGLSGASAQVPEPDLQDITVTGPRTEDEDQARRDAIQVVDSSIVTTRAGQLARWHAPVCARSWGMPRAYNAFIARRIAEVARQVGAEADPSPSCRPNVFIGFTADPQALLDQVVRRSPIMLGYHYASQGREVRTVRHPVQAWYATTTNDELDVAGVQSPGGSAASRLSTGVISGFAYILILVDMNRVADREVGPVADLLALLALAQLPVTDECRPTATIMNLLKPDCASAQELSRLDLAYLQALYATGPALPLSQQRSNMILSMSRELAGR